MDPAGFEPAISCVQSRRLPTRPRAQDNSRPGSSDWLLVRRPAIQNSGSIVPTRGFEPPHPEGQQILNLSRLPVPPRRHPLSGPDGIIPPILYPVLRTSSVSRTSHRHLSHPHVWMAAPDLPGVTRPHRRRCDETENPGRNQLPGPLALLPVARSPSRSCHHDRWWALTPPVRPLPAHPRCTGGNAFCCGCSQDAALAGLPPLAVSWGDLVPLPSQSAWTPEMQDRESGRSSRQRAPLCGPPPSDGSPIDPRALYHEKGTVSNTGACCVVPVHTQMEPWNCHCPCPAV